MQNAILLFFLFFSLFSDSGKTVTSNEKPAEFSLKMERTKGGGWGASYILTVQPGGKLLFEKINYIGYRGNGTARGQMRKEKIAELMAEVEKTKLFSLKDSYTRESGNCPIASTDAATIILSVKMNGREKTVTHYLGCQVMVIDPPPSNFPQELYRLENKIDEIVETKRWIGERK
jgi:hypothetical protein